MVYRGGCGSRLDDECASPFSDNEWDRGRCELEPRRAGTCFSTSKDNSRRLHSALGYVSPAQTERIAAYPSIFSGEDHRLVARDLIVRFPAEHLARRRDQEGGLRGDKSHSRFARNGMLRLESSHSPPEAATPDTARISALPLAGRRAEEYPRS